MTTCEVLPGRCKAKTYLIFLILITAFVYSGSLANGFVWDDYAVIVDNGFIKSWKNLPEVFSKAYLTPLAQVGQPGVPGSGEVTYRPLVTLTYFFDYAVWKLNPFGYHLTNLLLHTANACLLFVFLGLLLADKRLAFLAALVFAIHPINSEAVSVVSFREELLAVFFGLSSMIFFIRKDRAPDSQKRRDHFVSLALFFLALFSKEMAVTLPLLLILCDYFFVFNFKGRELLKQSVSRYGAYFAVLFFYLLVWMTMNGGEKLGASVPFPGGSFYTNGLTMSKIVTIYLGWLCWPVGIHVALAGLEPVLPVMTILSAEAIVSCAVPVFCVALAWALRKKAKEISFSIFWFFIALLPVLNIIPLSCIMASRFLYIPMIGFAIALPCALLRLADLKHGLPLSGVLTRCAKGFLIMMIVFFMLLTFLRNGTWKDNVSLWSEFVESYPDYPVTHTNLGEELDLRGQFGPAVREYKTALSLNPQGADIYGRLGFIFGKKGYYAQAIEYFKKAITIDPKGLDFYYNLGVMGVKSERWGEARGAWTKLVELDPKSKRSDLVRQLIQALPSESHL
ncbi:MAG: tetratricopeptide repeat protein [Candidatus Omnitrophota bacterium]